MKKASITIFLTFLLLFLMCFIFSLLEASRILCLKGKTKLVSQISMQSLGGNYHRKLWEEYHLLFLPSGLERKEFSLEALEEKAKEEGTYNLFLSQKGSWNFTACTLDKTKVLTYQLATDEEGAVFRQQVVHQMKSEAEKSDVEAMQKLQRYGTKILELLKESSSFSFGMKTKIHSITEIDVWKQELESIWKQAWKAVEEVEAYERQQEESQTEIQPEELLGEILENLFVNQRTEENPMEFAKKLRSQNIFSLLLENAKELSLGKLSLPDTLSFRKLQKGNSSIYIQDQDDSSIFLQVFLQKYYKTFSHKKEFEKEQDTLSYEMEYLLAGKESDRENLKSVLTTLLHIRTFFHYEKIKSHGNYQTLAREMAEKEVGDLIEDRKRILEQLQQGMLLSWAYIEAVSELRVLLAGGTVLWDKPLEQWNCNFSRISQSFDFLKEEKTAAEGFSYREYLQIFLFLLSDTTINYRCMDILENRYQIQMDTMIQEVTMEFEYHGKPLFWNMNFLTNRTWDIFAFPVEVSFSYLP